MKDSYIFYKDKLSPEYLAVFDRIEMYVLTQDFDDAAREERLGELLDIFLSSDEAGKPVEKITGGDLEKFCRTFCSDFGWKNRILSVLDRFRPVAWYIVIISVIDLLFYFTDPTDTDIWSAAGALNISGYFIGIIAAGIISTVSNVIIRRIMFREKRISMKVLNTISILTAVAVFFVMLFFVMSSDTAFFECPTWIMLVCAAVYLAIYYTAFRKRLKRRKIKFSELVDIETKNMLPETMEKKYLRAKKRRLRRGKVELTIEEFLDKEEKDCDRTEKMKFFYILLPLFIIVPSCISSSFDGPVDVVIYISIMLIVEYSIMLFFWRITKSGIRQRREWITEKRRELEAEGPGDNVSF